MGGSTGRRARPGRARRPRDRRPADPAVRGTAGVQGARVRPDTPWQRELEDAFPYTETPDQLAAIVEVKQDMELPIPMDRLICGDVGYGKTEIAVRAAFKAVQEGKQVAILVPTTLLAQQHFNTFTERMNQFPVQIKQLSRFQTPREAALTLEQAAAGTADIIIGTHRLLQSTPGSRTSA
jgi:transcription-repair coupling factor (superfamily II helicase)